MILEIKRQFYELIKNLGYHIADNINDLNEFPRLILRTSSHKREETLDMSIENIILTLDIFSTYSGEKEILEIADNIAEHLKQMREENPQIIAIQQKTAQILDDNGTGPIRKHGSIRYSFLLTSSLGEEEEIENG